MSWLSLAGAALGAAGSVFGSLTNKSAVAHTNQTNMEIAKYNNEWNLQQWHRENAYNHPTAQMARLKEAGINPNLAFSNGQLSNTTASSSPKASTPTLQAYTGNVQDFQSVLDNLVQGARAYEEIKQSKLETETAKYNIEFLNQNILMRQQERLTEFARRNGIHVDNYIKQKQSQYIDEQFRLTFANLEQDLKNKSSQFDLYEIQKKYDTHQIEYLLQNIKNAQVNYLIGKEDLATKRLDNELRKIGINPNDNTIYRVIGRALKNPQYLQELGKNFKTLLNATFGEEFFNDDLFPTSTGSFGLSIAPNKVRRNYRNLNIFNKYRKSQGLPPLTFKKGYPFGSSK